MKLATTGDFNRYLNTYQERIDAVVEAGLYSLYMMNSHSEFISDINS